MSQFDLFYKAYESYKREFDKNRDNILFKKANYAEFDKKNFISSIKVECKVEEDWVNVIERGVYYIAKAIKEDRQFIRNEGDVLPIEKIRRVSKDSIVDLSKHSNYITRKPEEGANIVPEKLLMINRENDYAIYENRVIYTILLYLKEFVSTRVNVLTQVLNKYEGKCFISKTVESGDRKLEFELKFNDVRNNDDIAIKNNKYHEIIQHLTDILNDIIILLNTNLMQEMSKHPTVSRPIIKTNVLKMNTNFKEALACYDYVCAYMDPGYEVKIFEDTICPLTKEQQDSFADIMLLSTFLAYEFNNNLEKDLKKTYDNERKVELENESNERISRLEKLKAKSPDNYNEYILAIEDGYKVLEEKINDLTKEIEESTLAHQNEMEEAEKFRLQEIERLDLDNEERFEAAVKEYEDRIAALIAEHEEAITSMQNMYEDKISKLTNDYEDRIETLTTGYEERIETLTTDYDERIETLTNDYEDKLNVLTTETTERINTLEEQNSALTAELAETKEQLEFYSKEKIEFIEIIREKEVKPLEEQIAGLEDELAIAKTAIFSKELAEDSKSYSPKDYTTKEQFTALEKQKKAFDKFFKEAWFETKKSILKEHYTLKKRGEE